MNAANIRNIMTYALNIHLYIYILSYPIAIRVSHGKYASSIELSVVIYAVSDGWRLVLMNIWSPFISRSLIIRFISSSGPSLWLCLVTVGIPSLFQPCKKITYVK